MNITAGRNNEGKKETEKIAKVQSKFYEKKLVDAIIMLRNTKVAER